MSETSGGSGTTSPPSLEESLGFNPCNGRLDEHNRALGLTGERFSHPSGYLRPSHTELVGDKALEFGARNQGPTAHTQFAQFPASKHFAQGTSPDTERCARLRSGEAQLVRRSVARQRSHELGFRHDHMRFSLALLTYSKSSSKFSLSARQILARFCGDGDT
jgi:hypothetical protein